MEPTAHEASADAIHKAKSAQQAVEAAREAQQAELVEKTALKTKEALLEGLREVFTNDSDKTPREMSVLIQRVPIICTSITQMHEALARTDANVEKINSNIGKVVWIVLIAVVGAVMKLVLIP